jgi:hypothetical protein
LAKTSKVSLPRPPSGYPFVVSCALQGYRIELADANAATKWVEAEAAYWRANDFSLGIASGLTEILPISNVYLARLASMNVENALALTKYFVEATQLNLVIGQSRMGEALAKIRRSEPQSAFHLATALTKEARSNLTDHALSPLVTVRAVLMLSPSMLEAEGLIEIADRQKQVKKSADAITKIQKTFAAETEAHNETQAEERANAEQWIEARKLELSDHLTDTALNLQKLKDLYQKHIQTEAAATYWNKRAAASWWSGVFSLGTFVALVAAPLWLGWQNHDAIKEFVLDLSNTSTGQISLTPIVAITVPVLAYGWVLRHISRLFIQSFTQADDARYRYVMTMTFLGLTKDPTSGVTDVERGIILNALFRPTPPNTSEDGPPAGLMDLVKPKT